MNFFTEACGSCWSKSKKKVITFWSKTKEWAGTFWKYHALDHYWLVGTFFIGHVLLVAADIITDILQANKHFQNGHPRWGVATIGFIMVSGVDFHDYFNANFLSLMFGKSTIE